MSKQNAVNFLTAVQKDATKYDQLATMPGPAVTKLAKDMGYPCQLDDIKAVLKEAKSAKQGLSDRELESVAGGGNSIGVITSIKLSCDCPVDDGWYPKSWDLGGGHDVKP